MLSPSYNLFSHVSAFTSMCVVGTSLLWGCALQGSGVEEGIVFLLGFQQVFCTAVLVVVLGAAGPHCLSHQGLKKGLRVSLK